MGTDVVIRTVKPMTAIEAEHVNAYLAKQGYEEKFEPIFVYPYGSDEKVETYRLYSFHRYFHPNYPRGQWPLIAELLREVQRVLPEHTILYGGDTAVDEDTLYLYDEVTDDFIAEMDAFWEAQEEAEGK